MKSPGKEKDYICTFVYLDLISLLECAVHLVQGVLLDVDFFFPS